jgi:hypothetical protein
MKKIVFTFGLISGAFAGILMVATWGVAYFRFMPDFADKYGANMIEQAKAPGATPDRIRHVSEEAEHLKQIYNNPIINIGFTILEIFPIGFIATLLSAALLHPKSAPPTRRTS